MGGGGALGFVLPLVLLLALVVGGVGRLIDLVPHLQELGGVGLLHVQEDADELGVLRVGELENRLVEPRTMVVPQKHDRKLDRLFSCRDLTDGTRT